MSLANLLLLIGLHLLVVEMLRCTLNIIVAELGVFLRFVGVIRQVSVDPPHSVGFTILQPRK